MKKYLIALLALALSSIGFVSPAEAAWAKGRERYAVYAAGVPTFSTHDILVRTRFVNKKVRKFTIRVDENNYLETCGIVNLRVKQYRGDTKVSDRNLADLCTDTAEERESNVTRGFVKYANRPSIGKKGTTVVTGKLRRDNGPDVKFRISYILFGELS